jgi:hypothetical protein
MHGRVEILVRLAWEPDDDVGADVDAWHFLAERGNDFLEI